MLCSLLFIACGEVSGNSDIKDKSSGSQPEPSSSSTGSSSSFDIVLEWIALDGYRISKNLITQGQYKSVMGVNPSKGTKNDSWPVEGVTWFKAMEFCDNLSVSLPTEAEWENAARQEAMQRNDDYWEWTSSCYDELNCIRKGLVNGIDDFYATDPKWDNIAGGYISFRVVKRN